MTTSADLFNLAYNYHCTGQLAQAEQLYQQVVAADPTHADAFHLLGVLLAHSGRRDVAIAYYQQAIAIRPLQSDYHFDLAMAFRGLGRREEGIASYRQVLALSPGNINAHNNLGNALRERGEWKEAEAHFRQALKIKPDFPEAHNNLANVLRDLHRLDEAAAHYQESVRIKPDYAAAHNNLGVVLFQQRQHDRAIAHYRQALALAPDYADAHSNLGDALENLGHLEEAEWHCREALRLHPDYAEAHNNLGNALQSQGRLDEALVHYNNVLQLYPEHAEAHMNRSILWLLRGDFERGWPEYEWRWRRQDVARRAFSQPRWDGSNLGGRTILLHAEQGLGDTLQFVRFIPTIKERGGKIILDCQPQLVELLKGVPGLDHVLPRGADVPPFDVEAPLLTVAGIMGIKLWTIPAAVPYLRPDTALAERWRNELSALRRSQTRDLLIGIAWQGNTAHAGDRHRSVPASQFARLGQLEGVQLVSLQVGPGIEQLPELAARCPVAELGSRFDPASLVDVAAVVASLDLIISVDTALVHLAGALGIPVWVAVPAAPDWRWMLEREDSPWYPTMRLFRRKHRSGWDEVFGRMEAAVGERMRHESL